MKNAGQITTLLRWVICGWRARHCAMLETRQHGRHESRQTQVATAESRSVFAARLQGGAQTVNAKKAGCADLP